MPPADTRLRQHIAHAMADLSARLGVEESEITVTRGEWVVWRDGSLGCPKPGMHYTQALVPGTFIQFRVGQATYNYHGGRSGPPTLCRSLFEVLPEDLPTDPAI